MVQKKNKVFDRYYVSFSDKLANLSYNTYKNIRLFFTKFKPLSEDEKYRFDDEDPFIEKQAAKMPEGFNYIENQKDEGYLKLDYIDLYDYLPKEDLESFMKELSDFVSKYNINAFGIHRTKKDLEGIYSLGQYFDGCAFTNISSFTIKDNEHLEKYCTSVSISLRNLSSTFLIVKYRFYIKQEFNDEIEKICKTEFKGYSKITRQFNVPWYNPKKFGRGSYTGNQTRQKKIYELISDLKWCALKELKKTFTIHFWIDNMFPPCFETYSTNIRPNKNRDNLEFWNSVMFDSAADYAPVYNACVCWDYKNSICEGVRLAAFCGGDYSRGEFLPGIVHHDISDTYAVYLTARTLGYVAERDIAGCNRKISRAIKKAKNTSVLKVRVDVERKLYYCYRFISEFTGQTINVGDVKEFRNEFYEKGSVSSRCLGGLAKLIRNSKERVDNVLKLLNDAAEYRSSEANLKLQRTMMFITILSLLVALISIDNSILTSLKTLACNIFEWIINFFKILKSLI